MTYKYKYKQKDKTRILLHDKSSRPVKEKDVHLVAIWSRVGSSCLTRLSALLLISNSSSTSHAVARGLHEGIFAGISGPLLDVDA